MCEKYQVAIPKAVLEPLQIKPGQKRDVIVYEGRAEFVPVQGVRAASCASSTSTGHRERRCEKGCANQGAMVDWEKTNLWRQIALKGK